MYFQARKNTDFNQYFVVAFDPIKISTQYGPQNDSWNLSFVKDIYRTRAIITRGLYLFYSIFHCGLYSRAVYTAERLVIT